MGWDAFEGMPFLLTRNRERPCTELLKGRNNRHSILEILRRSERLATTAEIADKFASEADLGRETVRLESALKSRFSAALNGLVKLGLVRQAGTADGRRHLWPWLQMSSFVALDPYAVDLHQIRA